MDEKDFATQSQGHEPVEVSIWAKRAIWCVGCGYLVSLVWWIFTILVDILPYYISNMFGFGSCILTAIIFFGSIISIIAGLICGLIALIYITLSKGRLKGTEKAATSVILSLIYIGLACSIVIPAILHARFVSQSRICREHLKKLGNSLKIYADENGKYPQADKWCDILLQGKYTTQDIFKCPYNKKARCSYAINPDCEPNSPSDVVLIFESRRGWNSYGGPELLTLDNHGGEGCFILFTDGHVSFGKVDPNGRFYEELNWGEKKEKP